MQMYSKADLLQIQSEMAPISYVVYYIYERNEPRQDYFDNYFKYTFVIDKPEKPDHTLEPEVVWVVTSLAVEVGNDALTVIATVAILLSTP